MEDEKNEDLVEKLKRLFDSVMPTPLAPDYPPNAVPLGTFARCVRNNRLGVIADAFYGDIDQVGEKIIVYTVLLLPEIRSFGQESSPTDKYYLINEYEYDVISYLMMPPVDIKELSKSFVGDFL